jgi:hypothetical protein
VLAKIAEMQEPDRTMAERLHGIIKSHPRNHSPARHPTTGYSTDRAAPGMRPLPR